MSGIFERLPGALEEVAMLRIHDCRVTRANPEEGSVEALNILNETCPADILWPSQ
jgi:hypothetical protein